MGSNFSTVLFTQLAPIRKRCWSAWNFRIFLRFEIFTVIPENYKTQNDIKIDVRIRAYSWIKMHKIELFWKKHSFDDDLKCICTFIWRIYKCSLQLWTWALSKFEFQMFVGFKTGTYSFIKLFILEYHNSEAVLQCLCNLNRDGLNWT